MQGYEEGIHTQKETHIHQLSVKLICLIDLTDPTVLRNEH